MQDIHLSPAEAAQRLGVSAKALRLYERHGLVTPKRAQNGWRAYGRAEMTRLHQVLALKALGLPLSKIAGLLAGRLGSLDAILELQERILGREAGRLGHALGLIRAARGRLAAGETLSIDDLANLTLETTMTAKPSDEEMQALFAPITAKHFTPEEMADIKQRKFDQADVSARWKALMAEAKRLMEKNDPGSPEAQDLARRWKAMIEEFTGGDQAMLGKLRNVWTDAFADPNLAPKLPMTPELMGFVSQAMAKLKEANGE
jgi:MerR family transcriptional regulator, thiopeptide resistance regulator